MDAENGECLQASPGQGEYSTIAGIDNSGKSLPGGFSNKPLSASQLAAIQAKDANVQQTTSNAASVASPADATSNGASQQVCLSCSARSPLFPCCVDRMLTYGIPLTALHSACPATSADTYGCVRFLSDGATKCSAASSVGADSAHTCETRGERGHN